MNRVLINMIGGGFSHDICSSAGSVPKFVEWCKDGSSDISIHIDYGILTQVNPSKINFAWLAESKTINSSLYDWCVKNVSFLEKNYELIFTHDKSLLNISPKFKLVICNCVPWVKLPNIYPKSKLISMIASNKLMCAEHQLRRVVIDKYKNDIDLYGRGYLEVDKKETALSDYYFSICMENSTYSNAYSEKITDCFACGTIPIYYGSPDIGEVFNEDGIIWLTDNFSVNSISPELYWSKIDAVMDNYNRAINFPIAEDWIYETYIKNYIKK